MSCKPFSYLLYIFVVVSSGRGDPVPIPPSWLEAEFSQACVFNSCDYTFLLSCTVEKGMEQSSLNLAHCLLPRALAAVPCSIWHVSEASGSCKMQAVYALNITGESPLPGLESRTVHGQSTFLPTPPSPPVCPGCRVTLREPVLWCRSQACVFTRAPPRFLHDGEPRSPKGCKWALGWAAD